MSREHATADRAYTEETRKIIRKHAGMAGVGGLVPIPAVDFVATSAINLKMLQTLAALNDVEFRVESARAAISSLVVGGGSTLLGFSVVTGRLPLVGLVVRPAVAAGLTLAIGRTFALHFMLGGSFHGFDPEAYRDFFNQHFERTRGSTAEPTDAEVRR